MAVKKPMWTTVWPPRVLIPANDAEARIDLLQRIPRDEWTCEDWQVWAEFLEWAGARQADELNEMRELAFDLDAKVPRPTKRGPKPKLGPTTIAGGRLGLARIPMLRRKGTPGRRPDQDAAEELDAWREAAQVRMRERGISREAALRDLLKEQKPGRRDATIHKEARALSKKLSPRVKPAR